MKRRFLATFTAFAAAFMMMLPLNVFAEGTIEITAKAEDGAVFSIIYNENEDGKLEYQSYKLVTESVPQDENDFPPQDGKGPYFNSEWEATGGDGEYIAFSPRFRVTFPERKFGVISMEGIKFYLIDAEAQTVHYAGAEVLFEEIVDPDEPVVEMPDYELPCDEEVYIKAEDGTDGYLYIYSDGNAPGYVISYTQPEDEYDFPEYHGGTGTYYRGTYGLTLTEDQNIITYDFYTVKEDGTVIEGEKHYLIDTAEQTLTYIGYSLSMRVRIETEDGAVFDLDYSSNSEQELRFEGYARSNIFPADEYDFPEYKGFTAPVSDPAPTLLTDGQENSFLDFEITKDDGTVLKGRKYYLIDIEKRTVSYRGHIIGENDVTVVNDGFTDVPDTGNGSSTAMLGVLSLAVMLVSRKKCKKG